MKYLIFALLLSTYSGKAQTVCWYRYDTTVTKLYVQSISETKPSVTLGYKVVTYLYCDGGTRTGEREIIKFLDRRRKPFPKQTLVTEVK